MNGKGLSPTMDEQTIYKFCLGSLITYDLSAHALNLVNVSIVADRLAYGSDVYEMFWTVYWAIALLLLIAISKKENEGTTDDS